MTRPIDLSGPLVDVDWLSNHIDHESVRIVDASFYLPHLNTSFDKEFAAARIPGARPFNIDLISSAESELPHMLPEAAAFGRAVGALGISNEHTIIAYDTLGMFSVARAWWMFRVFGHDAVAVLDGGLPAWRAAGHDVDSGPWGGSTPETFFSDFRPTMVRAVRQVQGAVFDGGATIIDARASARFTGEQKEFRPGLRSGHMPGSRNIPVDRLTDPETKRLLDAGALAALFDEAMVDRNQPIIATCGSGVSACMIDLALTVTGDGGAPVYDGSWTEWGGREDLPIVGPAGDGETK